MSYENQMYTLHAEEHDIHSLIKDCEWCPSKNQLTELLNQLDKESIITDPVFGKDYKSLWYYRNIPNQNEKDIRD